MGTSRLLLLSVIWGAVCLLTGPLPAAQEPMPGDVGQDPPAGTELSATDQSGAGDGETASGIEVLSPLHAGLASFFNGDSADEDGASGPNGAAGEGPAGERVPGRHFLSTFKLPDKLDFAGQPVPLDNWQVRERIEFEFYQFLESEGESIIMAKRTGRCFPPVETQLAEAGLSDDLKYMLLVESKCVEAAYSSKRASGPWQFIRSTGRRYKLKSNKWRDERRNLELSTEAAIKYLSHLHGSLGDWFLAMAAYNAGERRIKKRLKEQNVDDYWKFHYVRETMRYVPRIIAAKEIFSQPYKYLGVSKDELYEPFETETVTVRVKKRKEHLAKIAERYGTYFLELRMLNPELRRSHLPRGKYKLKIPKRECPLGCIKQDGSP